MPVDKPQELHGQDSIRRMEPPHLAPEPVGLINQFEGGRSLEELAERAPQDLAQAPKDLEGRELLPTFDLAHVGEIDPPRHAVGQLALGEPPAKPECPEPDADGLAQGITHEGAGLGGEDI